MHADVYKDFFLISCYVHQVSEMQKELTALQPELIQTSAETEKMMIQIEKETIEVDAKKELVSADEKEANEAAAVAKAIKVVYKWWVLTSFQVNLSCVDVLMG